MERKISHRCGWMTAALLIVSSAGCMTMSSRSDSYTAQDDARMHASVPFPRELDKVSLPTYRVEPPDILLIEGVANTRLASDLLHTGDQIVIKVANGLPLQPKADAEANPLQYQIELQMELEFKVINGAYTVLADGIVNLGPEYGRVMIAGLTMDGAKLAIEKHLKDNVGLRNPLVAISMPSLAGKQHIAGEHLVRPDGTVSLGVYGDVYVAGMTLAEIKSAIEQHLTRYIHNPEVNVDVLAYNSKVYYVITDGGGYGEQVIRLPVTGNETVLDAISNIEGLSEVSSKKVWIARPAPAGCDTAQILDVHWEAITREGITNTNYQILPGDRVYVQADHLIAFDNGLAKLFAPVERILGITLLGTSTVQRIKFFNQNSGTGFF